MRARVSMGLALAACLGCNGGASEPSCDEIADHVEAICGEGLGSIEAEAQRYECNTFGYPPGVSRCIRGVDTCDPDALDACGLSNKTWICSEADPECPPEKRCDFAQGECIVCATDDECPDGRICLGNWCVRDTQANRQLQQLVSM